MPLPPTKLLYKVVYAEQLGQVHDVDDEYEIYANSKGKVIATWSEFDSEDSLRVENTLEIAAGRLFLTRKRTSTEVGNNYEDFEILRLVLVPPAEPDPEPRSLYFDATELGLSVTCLYLEELGQEKITGSVGRKGRKIASWYDEIDVSGCFRNDLYIRKRKGQLLLERTWQPWWPYSGSGKQIYVISIPSTVL